MAKKETAPVEEQEGEDLPSGGTVLRKVTDLAVSTGNVIHERNGDIRVNALHSAAAGLHGWDSHLHHAAREMELTIADYRSALKAAERPTSGSVYRPHQPAVSNYSPFREVT